MRNTKLLIAVAVGAMLAGAASADAQTRPFTIGISGGPSIPSGEEFSEEAGTGYHVQGSVGITPTMLPVGVRVDLLWQEFPDEEAGRFREIGGLANAVLGLPFGLARPHLIGGVGLVNHNEPEEDHGDHAHEGGSETAFAYALGGGIQFPFLGLSGVLEARYLASGEHRSIPISFGIRF